MVSPEQDRVQARPLLRSSPPSLSSDLLLPLQFQVAARTSDRTHSSPPLLPLLLSTSAVSAEGVSEGCLLLPPPLLLSYNSIVVRVKKEGNKYSTAQVRTPSARTRLQLTRWLVQHDFRGDRNDLLCHFPPSSILSSYLPLRQSVDQTSQSFWAGGGGGGAAAGTYFFFHFRK